MYGDIVGELLTFPEILERSEHDWNSNIILKIDCEGWKFHRVVTRTRTPRISSWPSLMVLVVFFIFFLSYFALHSLLDGESWYRLVKFDRKMRTIDHKNHRLVRARRIKIESLSLSVASRGRP